MEGELPTTLGVTLTLTNSTITGNMANDDEGNLQTLTITNSTISGNTATSGGELPTTLGEH
jgi:hypothetical protein